MTTSGVRVAMILAAPMLAYGAEVQHSDVKDTKSVDCNWTKFRRPPGVVRALATCPIAIYLGGIANGLYYAAVRSREIDSAGWWVDCYSRGLRTGGLSDYYQTRLNESLGNFESAYSLPGFFDGASKAWVSGWSVLSMALPGALIGGVLAVGAVNAMRAGPRASDRSDAEWSSMTYRSFAVGSVVGATLQFSAISLAAHVAGRGVTEQSLVVLSQLYKYSGLPPMPDDLLCALPGLMSIVSIIAIERALDNLKQDASKCLVSQGPAVLETVKSDVTDPKESVKDMVVTHARSVPVFDHASYDVARQLTGNTLLMPTLLALVLMLTQAMAIRA